MPVLQKNVLSFKTFLFVSLEMDVKLPILADQIKLFFLIANVFEYEVSPRGCQVPSKFKNLVVQLFCVIKSWDLEVSRTTFLALSRDHTDLKDNVFMYIQCF